MNFDWHAEVITDPEIADLILEVAMRRPVIVPIDARLIENPYYLEPGPDYHVVVLVGFDSDEMNFIIHDPGTQYGENYKISYWTLMNAIRDWDKEKNDLSLKRKVLFTGERDSTITKSTLEIIGKILEKF